MVAPWPLSSTIRNEGAPAGVEVASAIALGSFGSLAPASASQASNSANGSPWAMVSDSLAIDMVGTVHR